MSKKMTNLQAGIAALCAAVILAACSHTEKKPAVAVTFEPQAAVTRTVAGDDFEVVTLLRPGSDPETYDPSMAEMTAMQKAGVYFTFDTPGFEQTAVKRLHENFPAMEVINLSQGIELITGTHGDHGADPHLWTSVRNMRQTLPALAQALAQQQPENADRIAARAMAETTRLQALDDSLASLLAPLRGRSFVVMHPSLGYFARDYGLNQIALETDGKEASPQQMKARLDSASATRPLLVVAESSHNPSQAAQAASMLGTDTISMAFNTTAWDSELLRLAQALRRQADKEK